MENIKKFFLKTNILFLLGRILIVGVFLYFGIESIFSPETYSEMVPSFVSTFISSDMTVILHGGVEVACALLILFGLGGFYPYILLALSFVGVLMSVSGATMIRDIGIFGSILLLSHVYLKRESSFE